MQHPITPGTDLEQRGAYCLRLAQDAADRERVQALRFEVFARELGATVSGAERGLDVDPLDARADHLMVIERETGDCVGSYRLVTQETAGDVRDFYTARIFDLSRLDFAVTREGVELGRACVALRHRTRGVFRLLLRGIGAYLLQTEKRFLFGCGSVPLKDPGEAPVARSAIEREGWLDERLDVQPTPDYTLADAATHGSGSPEIPALLYAYCAIGARLASRPAYDPDFRTLDFFVMLDLEHVEPRTYARYCRPR